MLGGGGGGGGGETLLGKIRDIHDLGDELLLVASDRISAYDIVLPTLIPGKGILLTQISKFWFDKIRRNGAIPHHVIETRGRVTRVLKCNVVPIEFVVRGYIAGSAWKEYQTTGRVYDISLSSGLRQCDKLDEPIFTPATKCTPIQGAEDDTVVHDENITFEQACIIAGEDVMKLLRRRSIELYSWAAEYALTRGIIIADTKFEWGQRIVAGQPNGEYLLIDEVLTPDSSRFWSTDTYEAGRDQDSFDKQYVRNYLTDLCEKGVWDKSPPGPELPNEIVKNTIAKYQEVIERLIGV